MTKLFSKKYEEVDVDLDGYTYTENRVYIYTYVDEHGLISGEWHGNPRYNLSPGASYIPPSDYFAPISPEERVKVQENKGNTPRWILCYRY